jgi:hypothetical protein
LKASIFALEEHALEGLSAMIHHMPFALNSSIAAL